MTIHEALVGTAAKRTNAAHSAAFVIVNPDKE